MAYFVYHCQDILDRERAAAIRNESLQRHLDYVEAHIGSYAAAGPNRHADGEYHSSTFILQAASLDVADAIMAGDPYVQAGLYQAISGLEFMAAAGEWVGGVSWR